MRNLLIALFFFLHAFTYAQSSKVQIAFLGVFHLGETPDYVKGGVDDLLSPERQQQVEEVVLGLSKFRPDKIFVENTPETQSYWNKVYKDYVDGKLPTESSVEMNEIFQIGIKLAKQIKHQQGVVCVNYVQPDLVAGIKIARSKLDTLATFYAHELEQRRPAYEAYFNQNPSVKRSFDEYLFDYESWKKLPIKQHLMNLNSESSIAALHYVNITGWMDTNTSGFGAEFTAKEYFRNTKIMQNILSGVSPSDRKLLVIIGGGHVQVLRDMIKTHPYFEVVDVIKILSE